MDEIPFEKVGARVSTFADSPIPIETVSSVTAKRLIRERSRQSGQGELSLDPLTVQAKRSDWPISAATLRIISAYRCFATVDPAALPDSAYVAYEVACQSLCATLVALEEINSLLD
jgi:hypothetical protein